MYARIQNHFAFSPNPWFIAAFFSGQVVLQLAWIRELFKRDPPNGYTKVPGNPSPPALTGQEQPMLRPAEGKDEERAWKVALDYAPVYALGNLCIGTSKQSGFERDTYRGILSWVALLLAAGGFRLLAGPRHHQHRRSTRRGSGAASGHSDESHASSPHTPCREDVRRGRRARLRRQRRCGPCKSAVQVYDLQ